MKGATAPAPGTPDADKEYAQARPGEASRRPCEAGWVPSFSPESGRCPLGSYRLTHTEDEKGPSLLSLHRQVQRDRHLRKYAKMTWEYVTYLEQIEKACFIISGYDLEENRSATNVGSYIHRWTEVYRKRQLARLYKLDDWWKENKGPVTMLTLTTYQDGTYSQTMRGEPVSIEESFEILRDGWDKLSKILRKYLPSVPYIWVVEPHKTGYPHRHVILFAEVPDDLQEKIRRLWSEKYCAGSMAHGVDFTVRTPDEDIECIRNYLMKYIAKGFISTGSKFTETPWTKEELVYNAIIWKKKCRIFQPSRALQNVMKKEEKENDAVFWFRGESEFEDPGTDERVRYLMWERFYIPEWLPFR